MDKLPLITIENLSKQFVSKDFKGVKRVTQALKAIDFSIFAGETVGLVGESGSGKSTLGKIILGFEQATTGTVKFSNPSSKEKMQIIFQDPYSALNPKMSALEIVREAIFKEEKSIGIQKAKDMLALVGILGDDVYKLPNQFSGGQRQRIGIARAMASNPEFILCDEPTSALDVSIQAQILALLQDLKDKLNLSYLFISHNLSVVEKISDRIIVLYRGQIVEMGSKEDIFNRAQHPYTKRLLNASLPIDPKQAKQLLQTVNHQDEIMINDTDEFIEISPGHFVRKGKSYV